MTISRDQATRIQRDFKVPVSSPTDDTWWVVCMDERSEPPTDLELQQIRSYCEFATKMIYTETWQSKILDAPLPICSGHNTVTFRKGHPIDEGRRFAWFYERRTWTHTPLWPPGHKALSLLEVLDHVADHAKWAAWKEERPDVFPGDTRRPS